MYKQIIYIIRYYIIDMMGENIINIHTPNINNITNKQPQQPQYQKMSTHQRKHRLSTITTPAGHSNGRRIKATGPQFNNINKNIQHLAYIVNRNNVNDRLPYRPSLSNKNLDIYRLRAFAKDYPKYPQYDTKQHIKQKKQPRRYSEAAQSRQSQASTNKYKIGRSLKILQQQNKRYRSIQLKKTFDSNPKTKSINNQHNSSMKLQPNTLHKMQQQQYINSDQFIQNLQRQKNKRIQQIYNPQSLTNSRINNNNNMYVNANAHTNSISLIRNINKNRNRTISINQLKTQQLLSLLNKDNRNINQQRHSRQKSMHQPQQSRTTSQQRYSQNRSKGKSISNLHMQKQNNYRQSNYQNNRHVSSGAGSKILPVTFQKIQQLSTINETAESGAHTNKNRNKTINIAKKLIERQNARKQQLSKERNTKLKRKPELQLVSEQQNTNNYTQINLSQNSHTNKSQTNLPFPKFNNFFQSYASQTKNNRENKTYLFEQLKNTRNISSTNKPTLIQSELISQNESSHQNYQAKKQKVKQLTIFNKIDKSLLKVIKNDDSVYYGEINSAGFKDGRGAIFYHDGRIYQGQFKNDLKEGYGIQTYIDGSVYSGQFKNGKRNGKGRFQWPNGQSYDGQWLNNVKHGSGLWESKDSLASYIGQWSHGTISGFGVLTNERGQRYQGQFQNFNKQGHGAYRFQNGDRMVGSFKNNRPNGQCQYFWVNGDYYKGQFSNGLRHGKGVIKYADGAYFQGQFRNDKKCGLGQQNYNDGIIYYGNYQNDLRHGFGKLIYQQVIYYEGYWINNVAVIFQEEGFQDSINQIIEDQKERLASGLSNNFSSNKLKKLGHQQQEKILKSMRSRALLKKSKIQKFSSKNLLQRLCQPKKRCKCLLKH